MGTGLAGQYYDLVWRAVREGPQVLEEVWGRSATLRSLFERASKHPRDSVALRFYVAALYAASKLLAEVAEAASEAPDSCEWAAGAAREAGRLALELLRDIRQERAVYRAGQGLARLVEGVVKALREASESVVECCEGPDSSRCLD